MIFPGRARQQQQQQPQMWLVVVRGDHGVCVQWLLLVWGREGAATRRKSGSNYALPNVFCGHSRPTHILALR